MSNSVDPDEVAYYELSHLDLHCLQIIWFGVWEAESVNDVSLCTYPHVNINLRTLLESPVWNYSDEISEQFLWRNKKKIP